MSINFMGYTNENPKIIDFIYRRYNVEKSLVNNNTVINFSLLDEHLKDQIGNKVNMIKHMKKDNIAIADFLYTAYYVAHARLAKLLHSVPGNELSVNTGKGYDLGKLVTKMLSEQSEESSERYAGYFNGLATKTVDPLTIEILEKRALEMLDTAEFSDINTFDDRKEILQVAYSTLYQLLKNNDGRIENPQEYMDVMTKTFFNPDKDKDLSDKEKEIYTQIKKAELEAIYDFLPKILLAPINGVIDKSTIESRYKEFKSSNMQRSIDDVKYLRNLETVYQSVLMSVLEKGGNVSKVEAESIIDSYKENIPKVKNQVIISTLLGENRTFNVQELNEKLKSILENDESEGIREIEDRMQLETLYGVLINTIRLNGGSASTDVLKNAMSQAQADLEVFKEYARRENRSPFKIYPVMSDKTPDEIYEIKLKELEKELISAIESGDVQGAQVILANANIYKELLEPAKNVDRRREEELITYDVDATKGRSIDSLSIGLCDIQLIRLGEPEEVITMENNVGDTIQVTRVGRFGYAAMRKHDGEPFFTDSMTTQEYLVTKTYNSRAKDGEAPEVKTYRVFSKTLIPNEMTKRDEVYSIYANQIFSDLSLEAAEKYNGGLIATVSPDVIGKDGTKKAQISFDPNTLDACLELERKMRECDQAEKSSVIERRKVKSVNNRLALVGNSNVELPKGYATRVFLHDTSGDKREDVLFAFEWSNAQKNKTIVDIVRNADIRSI